MSWCYKIVEKFRPDGTSGGTLVYILLHTRLTSDLDQHAQGLATRVLSISMRDRQNGDTTKWISVEMEISQKLM